jgi:iron-sulfur cluster assembly accessory protein
LEVAPLPRELVFLEVTPAAARELKAHAADVKLGRWWVRYTMTPGGCSGLLQHLDLDAGPPAESDFEFVADGVPCLLLKSQRHLLQGTRIDFGQKDGRRGFIITNPHATEGTKAAVAKWIASELDKRNADLPRPTDTN